MNAVRPAASTATLLLAGRTLVRFWRSVPMVISALVFPLLLMVTILAMFGELMGGGYVGRLAPLIVLSTATYGMPDSAVGFFRERAGGMLDRLRVLPIPGPAPLLGRVLGDVARIVAVGAIAVAAAHLAGFRFGGGVGATLGFLAVVALFGAMCTWIAVLVGLYAESEEAAAGTLNGPTTLIFFLSSAFVPLEAFPDVVKPLVVANPLSFASEALIALAGGRPAGTPLLVTVIVTVTSSVVCGWLAVRRFRR
ncbi:ABC transporter permease [Nonomuraea sp. NPDC050663]|uniref:ABC transporter permease n=1 Tax=Nonomuraea sp. NPDC050663 TaxID=3364370 RepID=UPI00378C4D50